MGGVPEQPIEWSEEDAAHIQQRSQRYPGAVNIDPAWTQEVATDPDRVVDEPDPKGGHANGVRIVGYSATAGIVVTVVGLRDRTGAIHGASAWKANGAERRRYYERDTS